MKNSLFIMAILLTACGSTNSPMTVSTMTPVQEGGVSVGNGIDGGVSVGNGMAVFSSSHGFEFQYDKRLHIENPHTRLVSVDTSTLSNQNISRISFQVLQSATDETKVIKSTQNLRDWLNNNSLLNQFEPAQLGLAEGFVSTQNQGEQTRKEYYMLAPNLTVLKIALLAFTAGEGQEQVNNVPKTLKYDTTPPIIQDAELENSTINAGDQIRLRLKTEEETGVSPRILVKWEHESRKPELTMLVPMSLEKQSGDTSLFVGKINHFAVEGVYEPIEILLQDRLGNQGIWHFVDGSLSSFQFRGHDTSDSPLQKKLTHSLQIKIENKKHQDFQFPKLENIETHAITNPETGTKVLVDAIISDDVAGIDTDSIVIRLLALSHNNRYRYEDWNHRPVKIQKIKDNQWKVQFEILLPPEFPSGTYVINDLEFNDHSGKKVSYQSLPQKNDIAYNELAPGETMSLLRHSGIVTPADTHTYIGEVSPYSEETNFRVHLFFHQASRLEDSTAPIITDLKLISNSQIRAGDIMKLRFSIREEGAGLDPQRCFVALTRPDSFFSVFDGDQEQLQISNLKKVGSNDYEGEYRIADSTPNGLYLIGMVHIVDRAGNGSSLFPERDFYFTDDSDKEAARWSENIDDKNFQSMTYLQEAESESEKKTDISVIRVQVTDKNLK